MARHFAFALAFGYALGGAALAAEQRYPYAQIHMGTVVRLVLLAPDEDTADRAAEAAYARVRELDAKLSDYRANSELNQLAKQAVGQPIAVSDDLWRVLAASDRLWHASAGAFDAAAGNLIRVWRAARKAQRLPTEVELSSARALSGWEHVTLDYQARTVAFDIAGLQMDLGGIAKGFVGDEVLAVLRAQGIPRALYEAGGDIVLGDPPSSEAGWEISFGPGYSRRLANCAIAASGDTAQYLIVGGVRYSHVIDPRSGAALTSRLGSHVFAPRGLDADGLATAATILGLVDGQRLVDAWPGAWGWLTRPQLAPLATPRPRTPNQRGLF